MVNDPTRLIFLYGKGGAGKDTQGKKMIADHYEEMWTGISTGDEIKDSLKNENHRHHSKVKPYLERVKQGINLPDEVVINLRNPREGIYSDFVESELAIETPVIISTGFPRKMIQFNMLLDYMASLREKRPIIDQHLYLDVSDEKIWERVEARRNQFIAEGKEPRVDDDPEVVKNRLKVFENDTVPVLNALRDMGKLHEVNADGTPEQVYELVMAELFPHSPKIEKERYGKERF